MADSVALVTGASRGIGRAIALALAQRGYTVAINYNSSEGGAAGVAQEIAAAGGKARCYRADVSDKDAVVSMVRAVTADFERIDLLVNNAGITRDQLLVRMSADDWDAVLNTNLKGAFLCTQQVARTMMRQRSGCIVNISSVSGVLGQMGQANYSASKAGLIGFTKAMARELARYNVNVNAIAPGFIATEMVEALPERVREEFLSRIPLGRLGTPEEVAEAVCYLVSPAARYITGQVLVIDGGLAV